MMLAILVLHVFLVTLLALTVGMACRWGRFRPAICHILWLVVLLKLSLPPVMAWPLSIQEILPSPREAFVKMEQPQAAAETTPAPAASDTTPPPSPRVTVAASVWRHVPLLVTVVWCIGALCVLARHVAGIRRFRALLEHAQPAPGWLQESTNELAGVFGIYPPSVMVVPGLASALVWNPWRPKVLISTDLLEAIRPEEWRGILSHELAHLKRRDLWVGWLELAATCVWWWNPLLSLVRRRLHVNAELACDAWVLWALPNNATQYAEVLFRIVSFETHRHTPVPAFGMAARSAAAFKARLAMLLQGGAACHVPRKAAVAAVILLLLAAPSLTPLATAAQHALEPITFGSSQPETTRDAEAVLETRLYLVKGTIPGLSGQVVPPDSGDFCYPRLGAMGVYSEIAPNQLTTRGVSVTMKSDTLLWNGKDEPEEPTIIHVASPAFALRPNETVAVAVALPVRALQWIKSEWPLQLSCSCVPSGDDLRLWLNVVPPHFGAPPARDVAPSPQELWTNVVIQTPLNQWSCLVAGVRDSKKDRATLLMFWKRRPCDPSQPVQELPGPAHNEFIIRHVPRGEQAPESGPSFTAEMKTLAVPTASIETLLTSLSPETAATTEPADLRVFKIPGKDEAKQLLDALGALPHAELLSAPRVTFRLDANGKIVLRDPSKKDDSLEERLASFSKSYLDFFLTEHPRAMIADFTTEYFRSNDTKSLQNISSGTAWAIATAGSVHDDTLDINVLYDAKNLIRRYRGHLFWKRELPPDIVETKAIVKMPFRLGEGICFVTDALDAQERCVSILAIDRVSSEGGAFLESSSSENEIRR